LIRYYSGNEANVFGSRIGNHGLMGLTVKTMAEILKISEKMI
jgi:hypothetical protein